MKNEGAPPGRRLLHAAFLLTVAAWVPATFGGCLYDPDSPCGDGFVFEDDACKCEEGSVLVGGKCVACGADEIAGPTGCEPALEALGDPCTTSDDCSPDGADTCVDDDGDSYCSLGACTTSEDCPNGYVCDVDSDSPVCLQGPEGFGSECSSSEECSGYEAAHCETLQERICMLECTDDPGVCPGDWVCCDLRAFTGVALCIPAANLDEGSCPLDTEELEAP